MEKREPYFKIYFGKGIRRDKDKYKMKMGFRKGGILLRRSWGVLNNGHFKETGGVLVAPKS